MRGIFLIEKRDNYWRGKRVILGLSRSIFVGLSIRDAEYQKKTLKKYLTPIFQQKIWGLIKDRDSGLQSVIP